MSEVRFRLSWQLALAIILVMAITIIPVIVYFLDYVSLYVLITSYILGYSVLTLIALMGAFLLGLAVGHRAASKTDFSPFEVEMLKMKEEVKSLKELLHRHNIHHQEENAPAPGPTDAVPPKDAEKPALVEEEPEPASPMEGAPEMKPVGKVRCSQCKTVIPLYSTKRPLEIKCTNCGKVGILR